MKDLTILIKPVSSLCNMRCRYCFYTDVSKSRDVASYGVMSQSTADRILSNIFGDMERGDHLTLAFQGGEPTMAGLDFFRHFTEEADRRNSGVRLSYAIQTNGLLLDEEWCAFLRERRFLVGLSIDGPAAFHNANRVDAGQKGTFQRVLRAKRRLDQTGTDYNVLMTLTASLARHPQQVWRFMEEEDLRFVQLTPCLGPLSQKDDSYRLTPERYAQFYIVLFDLWYQSYCRGVLRSVKLFDDLLTLLAFGRSGACGLLGQCQNQIVVEADGGVYPCDFYVLDEYRAGNLSTQTLHQIWEAETAGGFLSRPKEPLDLCVECPYRRICGGGCPRMRREVFYAPGGTVCGHRMFLDKHFPRLRQLARVLRSSMP